MIRKLLPLVGIWNGSGVANFPTIEKTEYIEETEFKIIDDDTMMFEQRTWRIQEGKKSAPLHWESGYIICDADGKYELYNAQNSKRVEVMLSKETNFNGTSCSLLFESKYFGNDERMVKTTREFHVIGNDLHFLMKMATQNTPEFQLHLESKLVREKKS